MTDEPVSQMIRVPTPLVDAMRELARLHRAGRTKAVLEGIERLVAAIDRETDIDIDSVFESISKLTERLEQLESERGDSINDIDIASVTQSISERLEKLESDIGALALTTQDLNTRVSDLEGVGDIGYAVTPLSERKPSGDITNDVEQIASPSGAIATSGEAIAEAADQDDITNDVEQIASPESPPLQKAPLSQSALAKRLGISDKAIQKHREKGKESFAEWSRSRDPDGIAWTWSGVGGRGQPLRFVPCFSQ